MKTFILLIFITLFGPFQANAAGPNFMEIRQDFLESSRFPVSYLFDTQWKCELADYKNQKQEAKNHFNFTAVLHNDTLTYNNTNAKNWFPRWYSNYHGPRNLLTSKTNDFLACASFIFDCADTGKDLEIRSYLRFHQSGRLLVEWTTSSHELLQTEAITRDEDEPEFAKTAIAYSSCELL